MQLRKLDWWQRIADSSETVALDQESRIGDALIKLLIHNAGMEYNEK